MKKRNYIMDFAIGLFAIVMILFSAKSLKFNGLFNLIILKKLKMLKNKLVVIHLLMLFFQLQTLVLNMEHS